MQARQSAEDGAPLFVRYVPAVQLAHAVAELAPAPGLYLPGWQSVHCKEVGMDVPVP
jgi:hypothetical protein